MEEVVADLVVIGSGPAGQKAAIQAAKLGKKVIVVDKDQDPGGSCLYSGTIPSKSLREAILDLTDFHTRSFYGKDHEIKKVSVNDLNYRLYKTIEEERNIIYRQFKKNDIRLITGTARFENPHVLIIVDKDFRIQYQIRSEFFVIATGSNPRNPHNVPFDSEVILDSTRLLAINHVPDTMLVLGGGIIGSEYASFFAALGTEVTVIDKKDRLLPGVDSEIGIHLQTALTDIGLKFIGHKETEEILRKDKSAVVKFKDGTTLEADMLLYALGRTANVESLTY